MMAFVKIEFPKGKPPEALNHAIPFGSLLLNLAFHSTHNHKHEPTRTSNTIAFRFAFLFNDFSVAFR